MECGIDIRSSRLLLMAGLLLHGAAILAVCLTGLSVIPMMLSLIVVLWSMVRYGAGGYRSPFRRMRIRDGVVRLDAASGSIDVSPPEVRFMNAGLVLLRFRHRLPGQRQRRRHLLLAPDSLAKDDRRVLYRHLRGWSGGGA